MASREEPPKPQPSSTSIKCPHPGACELLIASREIWSNQPFRTEAKVQTRAVRRYLTMLCGFAIATRI
jgi:hypothetical protein